jgi:hypothetical protein
VRVVRARAQSFTRLFEMGELDITNLSADTEYVDEKSFALPNILQ